MNVTPHVSKGALWDLYRIACINSQLKQGKERPSSHDHPTLGVDGFVDSKGQEIMNQNICIESQLSSWLIYGKDPNEWRDPELFFLKEKAAIDTPPQDKLAWIESFKLWLPEYYEELCERSQSWDSLPLHLTFAEMAGIDFHCLPPEGSFLSELVMNQNTLNDSPPYPRHNAQDIRQKIQHFFFEEPRWSHDMLSRYCNQTALQKLGFQSKRNWRTRVKRLMNRLLPLQIDSTT